MTVLQHALVRLASARTGSRRPSLVRATRRSGQAPGSDRPGRRGRCPGRRSAAARPAAPAQHAGLTLAEIRGVLALRDSRDSGEVPCGHVTDHIHQHLEEINRPMVELRKTRTVLRDPAQQAAETDPQSWRLS
ncbi:MerR family DNA-binding protein [Streptomyces anulatus]|uniref:MerR family DNA-binding protein n=1 Tax=Streptomyces anulatus TaxID=1892 RepID=UPI00403E2284